MDSLRVWTILGKLNHNLSSIHVPSIKLFDRLLGLISILVTNKREPSRVTGPSISRDEYINNFPVLVEEREQIICCGSESNVENEERVGVSDVRRAGSSEVRHCCLTEKELWKTR